MILIAVALFAALSYALTQSSRGGSSADKEIRAISASTFMQYIAMIEQTITRNNVLGSYD